MGNAPRGARIPDEGMRQNGRLVCRLARLCLSFAEGRKVVKDYGLPGAA